MNIKPLADRVLVKPAQAEEKVGGIIIPDTAKEKPQQAEVIAVGPGGMVNGKEVEMHVTAGQQVIYSKYAGTNVEIDDEEYIIVKQDDILAICE